jgi:Ala-tRNA(Pro) deacylase
MYVLDFLRSRGVWFESLLHQPASSSARRAKNVHVPGCNVAKTVLLKAGGSYVLAVLSSTVRIEFERLSETLGVPAADLRLATPDELFRIFKDCEPGVVPPFGRLYGLKTVVDSSLAEIRVVVFGANTRHQGLRMLFNDFEHLEDPLRASFTRPVETSRSTKPHRARPTR